MNICLIAVLLVIVIFGGIFFASKMLSSNTENNVDDKDVTPNNQVDYTIKKEETEEFLNKYGDYLYVLNNDEYDDSQIFYNIISYLVHNNLYTKTDDVFTFKEAHIRDLLRILYIKDNINYGSEGLVANYDEENKTISISIHIGLLNEEPSPERTITKTIKDFNFENGVAEVTYNIKNTYKENVHDQTGKVITESNIDYQIKFIKVYNELRIKEISKNMYNN